MDWYEDEWMGDEYGACMSIVDVVMVVGNIYLADG